MWSGGVFTDYWLIFCLSPLDLNFCKNVETVFFVIEQTYKFSSGSKLKNVPTQSQTDIWLTYNSIWQVLVEEKTEMK